MNRFDEEVPLAPLSIEELLEKGWDITQDSSGVNHIVPADDWTEDPQ